MKKVNISIRVETHMKAKLISILKNKTLNDYLQKAIEAAVQADEHLVSELTAEKLKKGEEKNEKSK